MFSFKLSDDFVQSYARKTPPFGFPDIAGNALGEITYFRTYSRKKEDGTKEKWYEACRRIVEGMYSIQKDHCNLNKLPWNHYKASRSAQEAYDRLFYMKWTPPGRGLQMMGTELIMKHRNSSSLNNCSFLSSNEMNKQSPGRFFGFVMEQLMLGIGVGFDLKGADKGFRVHLPSEETETFIVPDSREGWAEALETLVNSFLKSGSKTVEFDYSQVRPKGALIKTFGGLASGSQPLEELIEKTREILTRRAGEDIQRIDIADIVNLTGICVVSGSVRRSAELMLGDINDPNFIKYKDSESFPERNSIDPDNPGWSWLSNNSVEAKVGDDFSHIIDGIKNNGEPGIVWTDQLKKFGRLADPENNKDWRVGGVNPCLSGDSLLLTDTGWTSFLDAYKEGTPNNIFTDSRISYNDNGYEKPENWNVSYLSGRRGEVLPASEVFLTQKDTQIVKLSTREGFDVRLTPDHLVATKTRGMIAAEDLVEGEEILLTAGTLPNFSIKGIDPQTPEEMEYALMGLIAGDGTFVEGKVNDAARVCLWGDDRKDAVKIKGWIDFLTNHYKDVIICASNRGFSNHVTKTDTEIRIESTFLGQLLKDKYGFSRDSKHSIPDEVMKNARTSSALYYVAGLFYSDGTFNKVNKVGSCSIRLGQSNKNLLQQVQLILLANGIESKIYLRKPEGMNVLPDGRGGSKEYLTKDFYELLITTHKYEFSQYVGFLGSHKDETASKFDLHVSKKFAKFTATVESVVPDGVEDVYCLKEQTKRVLCANGISMRRCAEISLESTEMCTLSELWINNNESLEELKRSLKFAYLYAKTVTLLSTPWPDTNAVMQRNRRIGVGLSGVADFSDNQGLPKLREWADEAYKTIADYDKSYSEWLCVRESIKLTTVKPSGTTGIVAGTSPGVHWSPGGKYFLRAIRLGADDPLVPKLQEAGYKVEPDVMDKRNTMVAYFPIKSNAKRSEREVTIFEKAELASTMQKYWADNAVSVTISFDKEEESKFIETIIHMYEGKLKTVSFLPMGNDTYPQMPYQQITEEEYESYRGKIKKVNFGSLYKGKSEDIQVEKFCTTDVCEMPSK